MSSTELKTKTAPLPTSSPGTSEMLPSANDFPTTSFVLKNAPQHLKPTLAVACMNCPLAVWLMREKTLECYCRTLCMTVWETNKPGNIRMCDAPEQVKAEALASGL